MTDIIETIRAFERPSTTNKHDHAKYVEARDTMQKLIDLTNTMGCEGAVVAGMVEGLVRNHRYLQGKGVICLLRALGEYGTLPAGQFTDPRNEFAHETCGKMRKALRDELFWKDAE